jgi:hypothetical protein
MDSSSRIGAIATGDGTFNSYCNKVDSPRELGDGSCKSVWRNIYSILIFNAIFHLPLETVRCPYHNHLATSPHKFTSLDGNKTPSCPFRPLPSPSSRPTSSTSISPRTPPGPPISRPINVVFSKSSLRGNNRNFYGLVVGRQELFHEAGSLQSLLNRDRSTLLVVGSDSRVPESVVLDSKTPGEIFVHRNIANTFRGTDDSCHSVLEYGVGHLGIKHGVSSISLLVSVRCG